MQIHHRDFLILAEYEFILIFAYSCIFPQKIGEKIINIINFE